MKIKKWMLPALCAIGLIVSGCGNKSVDTPNVGDASAPKVSSTTPAKNAADVPVNTLILVGFSESMKKTSITTSTITLTGPSGNVSGTVTATLYAATFKPSADLLPNVTYTATVTTGVTDLNGNAMAADYSWSFATSAVLDTTPPVVSSTTPTANATNVAPNSSIVANFSEAMDPATITGAAFTLTGPAGSVAGTVLPIGAIATFTPSASLASASIYTAMVTTAVKDLAGNAMASAKIWRFTTATVIDTTPPTVTSTSPLNAATNVALNKTLSVTFSEAMLASTLTVTNFLLTGPSGTESGIVTVGSTTVSFKSTVDLAASATYTAIVTTGVTDLAGNPLAIDHVWSFTTGSGTDTTPPQQLFSKSNPGNGTGGNPVKTAYAFCYDEAIDPGSVNATTFTVIDWNVSTAVPGTRTVTNNCISFKPNADLRPNAQIVTDVPAGGVTDLAGNSTTLFGATFWTGALTVVDSTAPSVTLTVPDVSGTGASLGPVYVYFSEAIYPPSIDARFTLNGPSGAVSGSVYVYDNMAIFLPAVSLDRNALYTATIAAGVTDLVGNSMSAHSWTFTTTNTGRIQRSPGWEMDGVTAVDTSGNVYLAGTTNGVLTTSTGTGKGFLAKYNSSQVEQWVVQFGGTAPSQISGVAVDAVGAIYVTGTSTAAMDGELYAGGGDMFLMKFDASGAWQWTRLRGTASSEQATSVAIDTVGDIYVAGSSGGNLDGNTNQGSYDMFLMKFNASGAHQWTELRGSSSNDTAFGVTTFDNGSGTIFAYVAGSVTGTLDGATSNGGADAALIAYDVTSNITGSWQWTQQYGSSANDQAKAVAVDTSGNIYLAGYTYGNFASGATYTGSASDAFVSKCTTTGLMVWSDQIGATGIEEMNAIAVDGSGNMYAVGRTTGSIYMPYIQLPLSSGSTDIFLVKYDTTTGTKTWGTQINGWWNQNPMGIAYFAGRIYVSGTAQNDFIERVTQNSHRLYFQDSTDTSDAFLISFDALGNRE